MVKYFYNNDDEDGTVIWIAESRRLVQADIQ